MTSKQEQYPGDHNNMFKTFQEWARDYVNEENKGQGLQDEQSRVIEAEISLDDCISN